MRTNLILFLTLLALNVPLLAAPARDAAWVDQRIKEWQPRPSERSWEQIGWAKDLLTAEKLGRERGRPIFLFTHDGHLAVGRC